MTVRVIRITSHRGPFSGVPGCAGDWKREAGWGGKHQPDEHNGHNTEQAGVCRNCSIVVRRSMMDMR